MKVMLRPSDVDIKKFQIDNMYTDQFPFSGFVSCIEDLIVMCCRCNNRWVIFNQPMFEHFVFVKWNTNFIVWLIEHDYIIIIGVNKDGYYRYKFTDKFYVMLLPYWKLTEGWKTTSA